MQACNQIEIDVRQKNKKVYKPTKKTYDKFLEFANKKYKKNEIYKNSKFSISDNNDLVYKNDIILLHNFLFFKKSSCFVKIATFYMMLCVLEVSDTFTTLLILSIQLLLTF
jgi:hypothetical protein